MTRQEQLCAQIMRIHGASMSPRERALPWTYLYRQWVNEEGDRCCEVTGILIDRDDGTQWRIDADKVMTPEGLFA